MWSRATRPRFDFDVNSRGRVARDHTRLHFNHYVAAFNFQGIDSNLSSGIVTRLSRPGVPLPAVPGTNHFISLDQALPQGAASVQADVVHGRDSSVHVGYAYYSVTQGKFFGFALGGKVGLSGKFYEVGHETFLNYESALPSGARPGQPGRLSPPGLWLTTEDRRLFRLQRLRDHHLALEILHHVGIEAYFGGTLGQ